MNPESTSSMVERVGQAIADEVIKRESINADEWPIIARAAIAAMRKADPFMTAQGARTLNGHTSSAHTQIVQDVYEAMIDAALKD